MLANRERILQKMDEFNLDCIIASHPENVSYLADFQSHLPYMYRFLDFESYAIFARSADIAPALVINIADVAWAARYPSWVEEIYTFGAPAYTLYSEEGMSEDEARFKKILDDRSRNAPSPGEAIVKALKQKGLAKGRVGLDEKNVYPRTREQIKDGLPKAEIIDCFELFRVIRMVKTPEEIDRLKTVGLKNERAVISVIDRLSEGVSEEELTQEFLESVAREGAVFEFWQTASGTRSSMIIMSNGHTHPHSRYRLKKGDIFRYDGGCIYNKYHADAGGCVFIGEPTRQQKIYYRAMEAGMEKAMELLRPGALPSEIFHKTVTAAEKAGLKDYSRLAHFVGHGIGIEARDYPVITRPIKTKSPFLPGSYDVPIEENMVINIEVPYVRLLGLGGFQFEYTLLVKADNCEKLYPHERDLLTR